MSVRTANRMLNRHSAALPTRPFDACDHGGLSGGHGGLGGGLGGGHNGHTLYSESGSQRSLGEFSQGSQDDSLRRHGSSHVPKPPLFNTPKHMYSGADTSLPLDPGCLHHLLRKVGDHDTTVKAQETSIRMLQDRLTRMGHSVVELTQSNAKQNEELKLLREQLASSSRHAEDAMLASQREQSGRMEQMVLQLQLQISDALAERSSPAAAHKRSRKEVIAELQQYQHHQQYQQQELMSEDEDEGESEGEGEGEYEGEHEEGEGEQRLQMDLAPAPTYSPAPSEATTTLDLFGDSAPPLPQVQHVEPSPHREPPHREPRRVVRTYSRASRSAQPAPRSFVPFGGGAANKRVHAPGDETRRRYTMTDRVRATTLEHY